MHQEPRIAVGAKEEKRAAGQQHLPLLPKRSLAPGRALGSSLKEKSGTEAG